MTPLSRRWIAALIVAVGLATRPASAAAADGPEPGDVKAAFILNFAKFTEWPGLPPAAPVVVCVLDDPKVAGTLAQLAHAAKIGSHPIEVRTIDGAVGPLCEVLYLSAHVRDAGAVLGALRGAATLTISDANRFASSGGMIEFFVERDRMRFAVNVTAAQRAQVRLSSRLLGLARIVRDDDAP